jgi:O-acetyl-ADP-ribose deacetylase (regulator of RNase III)
VVEVSAIPLVNQMSSGSENLRLRISAERVLAIVGPCDITKETCDAIVNAANSSLMGGGGVDGAIHRAGGPAILEACEAIVTRQGRLPAGQAIATPGGRLAARYVIHTVGPVWSGGNRNEPETLASCHTESIRVADELELRNVAFPAISTGIYGYPVSLAATVAISSAADALQRAKHVREVRFVLFDRYALEHFLNAARAYAASKSIELDSYHAS